MDLKPTSKYSKGGNQAIPPEQVLRDTWYSITINPADKYQFWNNEKRLLRFYAKAIENIPMDNIEGHLFLELSKNGRLHYHGEIRITDTLRFFLDDIKKLEEYGHYEIDTIAEIDDWIAYCLKQQTKLKELAGWNIHLDRLKRLKAIKLETDVVNTIPKYWQLESDSTPRDPGKHKKSKCAKH